MSMKNRYCILCVVIVITIVFILFPDTAEAQCAMCKQVAETDLKEGTGVARGINNGIVYLMGLPYILIGIVAFLFIRKYKKDNLAKSQETSVG